MHLLTEEHILTFLLQMGLLLGLARLLGEVFRRFGQPSISAEILVGIFFGPSVLGRIAPDLQVRLFPTDPIQQKMLGTLAWLGILFFLLKAGLETNFATAWRQRGKAVALSFTDLTVPMLIAFVPTWFLPEHYLGGAGNRLLFSLFIAVIMTISALPVTARVLQDLKIYRTDLGLLIMSALTINDVAGWIVFALILGTVTEAGMTITQMLVVLIATLGFATFCLTWGARLFNAALGRLARHRVPEPAGSLTLVCVAGLLGGAVTTAIGIHALFGFFIAGIMAGEASRLSENTRHVFDQMVQAVLVPIFFTAVGLKLDFFGNFDLLLVLFILGIGIAGRYIGAYLGARAIGQPSLHSRLIADAHIPGGEMQIVIGILALEYGVISETVYVAIVFGAIATSILSGPLMGRLLRRIERVDWLAFLPVDHVLPDLVAASREDAIRALSHAAAPAARLPAETIETAVLSREREMSTAAGDGIAIPHARFNDLERPVVVFARARGDIEWNAPDGHPARLLFLVLTPTRDPSIQLQLLRGISRGLSFPDLRSALLSTCETPALIESLREGQQRALTSKARRNHPPRGKSRSHPSIG